jgi:hypothetical protein
MDELLNASPSSSPCFLGPITSNKGKLTMARQGYWEFARIDTGGALATTRRFNFLIAASLAVTGSCLGVICYARPSADAMASWDGFDSLAKRGDGLIRDREGYGRSIDLACSRIADVRHQTRGEHADGIVSSMAHRIAEGGAPTDQSKKCAALSLAEAAQPFSDTSAPSTQDKKSRR